MTAFRARASIKEPRIAGRRSLPLVGGSLALNRRNVPGISGTLILSTGGCGPNFRDPYTLTMPTVGGTQEDQPVSEITLEIESQAQESATIADHTAARGAGIASAAAVLAINTRRAKEGARLDLAAMPDAARQSFRRLVVQDWEADDDLGTVTLHVTSWDALLEDDASDHAMLSPWSNQLLSDMAVRILRVRRHVRTDIPWLYYGFNVPGGGQRLMEKGGRPAQAIEAAAATLGYQLFTDYDGVWRLRDVLPPAPSSWTITHPEARLAGVKVKRSRSGEWADAYWLHARDDADVDWYLAHGNIEPRPGNKVMTEQIATRAQMSDWATVALNAARRRGHTITGRTPWTRGLLPGDIAIFPYTGRTPPRFAGGAGRIGGTVLATTIDLRTGEATLEMEG